MSEGGSPAALSALGLPVGRRGGPDLPPPLFDADEAVATALRLAAVLDDPGSLLRSLGYLPPAGPAAAQSTGMPPAPATSPPPDDGALVAQADEGGKEGEGEEIRRDLEPLNRDFPGVQNHTKRGNGSSHCDRGWAAGRLSRELLDLHPTSLPRQATSRLCPRAFRSPN